MTLRITLMDFPSVRSGAPLEITAVDSWKTEHGELWITHHSNLRSVFAAGKWISVEALDEGKSSSDGRSRKSELRDLAYVEPAAIERSRAASVQFAIDNKTVPWSEAHMRAVLDYERLLANEYGEDAVLNLPWNRLPRGSDAR